MIRSSHMYNGNFVCVQADTDAGFLEEANRFKFLALVSEAKTIFSFHLHAYSLTPRRTLLLIETAAPPGAVIRFLQNAYRQYLTDKYPAESRAMKIHYIEQKVWTRHFFIELCKFIHLAPCFEGLCSRPSEWKWSSYDSYIHIKPASLTDRALLYSFFPAETLSALRTFHERELESGTAAGDLFAIYTSYLASMHAIHKKTSLFSFDQQQDNTSFFLSENVSCTIE
jgi:putative transposase